MYNNQILLKWGFVKMCCEMLWGVKCCFLRGFSGLSKVDVFRLFFGEFGESVFDCFFVFEGHVDGGGL